MRTRVISAKSSREIGATRKAADVAKLVELAAESSLASQ
jgi:hypothetical protein